MVWLVVGVEVIVDDGDVVWLVVAELVCDVVCELVAVVVRELVAVDD